MRREAEKTFRLVMLRAEVVASTPHEFGAFLKADIAKWGKLVRDAAVKAE